MPEYRGHILIVGLSLIMSLQVSGFEQDTPPDSYGWVANLVIQGQQPLFWLTRKTIYPEMSFETIDIDDETYSYLIRKGEREGVILLLHGIMSRKDHFMPMVHHWVKMKKSLPTIIAVDLMGHGSHSYPEDFDFTIEHFTWHAARFIRNIQKQYNNRPFIILGHSLGGAVATLLRPLEDLTASALILISPAGIGSANTTDFKSDIELAGGLPFDFGSAGICRMLEAPFEEHRALTSFLLKTGCFLYSLLDCPYETWMKNRMFAHLALSEQQLLSQRSDKELIGTHFLQPVFLIWTRSDRMFDPSRYTSLGEYLIQKKLGDHFEFEGSHVWLIEHPDEAAKAVDSLVDRVLPLTAFDTSPANPVYLIWLTSVMWHLVQPLK